MIVRFVLESWHTHIKYHNPLLSYENMSRNGKEMEMPIEDYFLPKHYR